MNEKLKEMRMKLLHSYLENKDKDIKQVEIAFQDIIESYYEDKCWWQVCDVNIFLELVNKPLINVVEMIIAKCEDYENKMKIVEEYNKRSVN